MNKVKEIEKMLLDLDPETNLIIEDRPDGSTWIIGPYPSFIIMVNLPSGSEDGFIVSVQADAPKIIYFLKPIFTKYPDLQHYGPYCEDEMNNTIVGGPEAYELLEDVILRKAAAIYKGRKEEADKPKLIVPEQKIILTGNQ